MHIQPGRDEQITQIPLKYTRVKYPPHTSPSRPKMMQTSVKYPHFTDPPDHTTYLNPADHTDPADHADPPI